MKKLIFCALLLFMGVSAAFPQKWEGNTIVATATQRAKAEKTPYTYKDTKGKSYPIYISKSGSCFVEKTSKNGKTYHQYLGKEISAEICKKLGRTYKPKK